MMVKEKMERSGWVSLRSKNLGLFLCVSILGGDEHQIAVCIEAIVVGD